MNYISQKTAYQIIYPRFVNPLQLARDKNTPLNKSSWWSGQFAIDKSHEYFMYTHAFTHYPLVMQYGDEDIGQSWLR